MVTQMQPAVTYFPRQGILHWRYIWQTVWLGHGSAVGPAVCRLISLKGEFLRHFGPKLHGTEVAE
jgi:hypothetical protein